jgi:hypothetical protein
LSGELGEAVIETVVPGEVGRYWFLAANLDVTTMRSGGDPTVGEWFSMRSLGAEDGDDADPITGTNGEIRCQWTELDDPNRVAMRWQWLGPEGWDFVSGEAIYERIRAGTLPRQVPRLARPSGLTIQFTDAPTHDSSPTTTIHLVHADVPVEWISDLVDYWNSKIDTWIGQAALPDKHWRSNTP